MVPIFRIIAVSALAIGLALDGPTNSKSATASKGETYRHCATSVIFPAEAGGLARASINIQDPKDCFPKNITYLIPGLRGYARIWIIPGYDVPCSVRFAKEAEQMSKRYWGLEPRPTGAPLRLLGSYAQQHTVRYTHGEAIGGRHQKPETVLTLWIGCIGPGSGEKATWLVRYEGDFAAADEAKVADLAEKLFAAIDWSPLTAGR